MISPILLLVAGVGTYFWARRSLAYGFASLLLVGYVYGIFRANFLDSYSYLLFDAALLGLYAARLFEPLTTRERARIDDLRTWLCILIGWPVVLFLVPRQDILVELVGLRGNIFMLPCLLLGARLTRPDMLNLGWCLAWLNLAGGAFAATQFVLGIEPFFPRNAVTELIYRSGDIANHTQYRIPSSFSSAHAYGGTMLLSLPLVLGAWMDPALRGWRAQVLAVAVAVSVLGIFSTGARLPVLQLAFAGVAVLVSGRIRVAHKVRWLAVAALVGWVVSGEVRFQRFLTLADTDFVSERVMGSVNMTFLELAEKYPLGNGLGGGGTSIPYFLRDRVRNSAVMENEYARILLEQGIPGVIAWIGFIGWLFTRSSGARPSWPQARVIVWATSFSGFATGLIGIGMLTSIPGTALLMLSTGWMVTPDPQPATAATAPRAAPALQYGTR